mmetsp:Transcript_24342/g.54224  ORF Transcript_24342/g.54224 Transcript_24342/m.54224 type:complete len:235 (-) Transcript_24342:948-1652(-)
MRLILPDSQVGPGWRWRGIPDWQRVWRGQGRSPLYSHGLGARRQSNGLGSSSATVGTLGPMALAIAKAPWRRSTQSIGRRAEGSFEATSSIPGHTAFTVRVMTLHVGRQSKGVGLPRRGLQVTQTKPELLHLAQQPMTTLSFPGARPRLNGLCVTVALEAHLASRGRSCRKIPIDRMVVTTHAWTAQRQILNSTWTISISPSPIKAEVLRDRKARSGRTMAKNGRHVWQAVRGR